ncbi:hypothetical protein [Chryseolinea lacunae]|uniref:Uncharacterized protein n=1 Tax=Chryseolinea lacunae TaxID=2801331 RepID=A0ABS1KZB7_9BACT|nr:hypothetical protein [Chryseolinea lacunae]MBL0744805.1 hypothetical protein [Chryseolinea lacunae]
MKNFVILLFCVALVACGYGQSTEENTKPYCIDFEKAGTMVHVVQRESIGLQYYDAIGMTGILPVVVYNARHDVVSRLALQKTFGLNQYTIALADLGATTINEVFTCETRDDRGHTHRVYIRPTETVKKEIGVDISSDVISLHCYEPGSNTIDFYGAIQSTKGPYRITWFVLDEHQANFLYQPVEQVLEMTGEVPTIRVDKAPDYYVVLFVVDGCGNEGKQMVHVICDKDKRKIDTVFLEAIPDVIDRTIRKSK